MSDEYCRGCGSVIQSLDPAKPGYVPADVATQNKKLICQRCYKIRHYGDVGTVQPGLQQIKQNIIKAVNASALVTIVVDFSDLTGTLPVWQGYLMDKPYILVLNKSDLLPIRTKSQEIVDYLKQYLAHIGLPKPEDIILTSGVKGSGIGILVNSIKQKTATGGKVAFLGATNVGKSSLIKQILAAEDSTMAPTVSKFPGTTLGLSNWSILKSRNTLIDTPGLAPGDRMGDLLCPECSCRLLSTQKIAQKLYNVKPGKAIIMGGLAGFAQQGLTETVIIGFSSPEIKLHNTDNTRVADLLQEAPAWLRSFCPNCAKKLHWDQVKVNLTPHQDLSVAGLGWISIRGAGAEIQLTLPQGVRWEIRPALVGKK